MCSRTSRNCRCSQSVSGRRTRPSFISEGSPRRKDLTDLLRAMQDSPYVSLKIAGEGPQRAELEQLVKQLDLVNVEFVGRVVAAQLDRLISSSRFTVLPSHAYETLGKSILESYAWGRAVVASDLGSRRELVHEGETGVLYRAGDVAQLAGRFRFWSNDRNWRRRWARRGVHWWPNNIRLRTTILR